MTRNTTGHVSAHRTGRRTLALAAAAAAAAVCLPAGVAHADTTPATPAVVGPLLQIFTFGADVGLPTGCQEGTATFGAGASALGIAQKVGKYITTINNACTTVQTNADTAIATGNKDDAPLVKINPYVNPVIGEAATSVTQLGTQYGPALAPFGPTIAGLGGTINFFQGHPAS